MTGQEAEEFAGHWVVAWNSGDVEAVLEHFAEDAVFTSPLAERVVPGSGGVIRGKDALRHYWTTALSMNPGLHFDLLDVYWGVDTVVIRFRRDGRDRCEVLTFAGGLVTAGHGTYAALGSPGEEGTQTMKLAFAVPHMMRLKAMRQPWEASVTGADQTRLARWADKLGYAMISVPEHYLIPDEHVELSGPHYFSAYPAMAYLAGATERIRVNSCVALLPLQHPVVTAKTLATIDWMSGGRLMVTFGVGWLEKEFDIMGVPFRERGARSEEYIQAIIELWTAESPSFEGRYVSFSGVAFEPKPVQRPHPPVWFGGDANPALRRVARYASGWWPFLTKTEDIPARLDYIRSQPDYSGGLTDVFAGFATQVGEGHVARAADPKARAGMSKEEIIDRLGWMADLGVTMTSVPVPKVSGIAEYMEYTQWVAEEIMPRVDL
jgi:probable F420-dependent oxidoreductase